MQDPLAPTKRKIPPLNALKAFEAAARHGSFRDAAKELNVSHSAISHQIKHLEEYLGLDLFLRKARAVELTTAGQNYYPVLREAFDRIAEGTKVLLRPTEDNVLTVQMYSTFAVRWLIPRLERFYERHPALQVRLITAQGDPDFERQDIDLGLLIGAKTRADIHYEELFTPHLFPVCSPALLESAPLRSIDDLASQTILQVYPSAQDWTVWLQKNGVSGIRPDEGLQFDSYDHALATAIRGIGVALGQEPYVAEDLEAGHLVCPFPTMSVQAGSTWYLVYPAERERTKKIRLFRDWLLEEVQRDPVTRALTPDLAGERRA